MPVLSWNKLLTGRRKKLENGIYSSLSPFERDYFAIVQSSYYRRLKEKTQVFPLETNDYVRTRMAHSTEVSSIAEILGDMIARRVASEHEEDLEDYYHPNNIYTRDSKDFRHDLMKVLACAGLLHDIGNPPFGHTGEKYIREWVKSKDDVVVGRNGETLREILDDHQWEDLTNFEGNAQALRIVTHIANPTVYLLQDTEIKGLNLTYAVLGSIIKYPYSSLARPDRNKPGKMGFYRPEWEIFDEIAQETGTYTGQNDEAILNPVMLILEAADDIAYTFSDIEDFVKKDFLNLDQFYGILKDPAPLKKQIEKIWKDDYKINRERSVTENKVSDRICESLFKLRAKAIDDTVNNFMNLYPDIMNGAYNRKSSMPLFQADDYIKSDKYKEYRNTIYKSRDAEADIVSSAENNLNRVLDAISYVALSSTDCFDISGWMTEIELSEVQKREIHEKAGQYINHIKDNALATVGQVGFINKPISSAEYAYSSLVSTIDFTSGMTDRYVSEFLKDVFTTDGIKHFEDEEQKSIMTLIQGLFGLKTSNEYDNVRTIFNRLGKYTEILSKPQKVQIIKAVYADGKDGQIVKFINYVNRDGNRYNRRYGEWLSRLGREIKMESESWDDLIDTVMQWIGLVAS